MITQQISDTELLLQIKEDDHASFDLLFDRYWERLYRVALSRTGDDFVAQDIVQELFIKLWDNRSTIYISVSLKAYLYASIRYEVYRQVRSSMLTSDVFETLFDRLQTPVDYENIEYKELIAQVNSAVNALPQKCREVYKLSREEYLSHKQISSRLNISTKTVENHLTKALKQLRTSLGSFLLL